MAQNSPPSAPSAAAPQPAQKTPSPPVGFNAAATPSESQAAEAMALKYVEMWNTGRSDLGKGMFAPQFVMHMPDFNLAMHASGVLYRIGLWRKSIPDLNLKVEDTLVQDDKVMFRIQLTGTYKEGGLYSDTPPPPPGGPPVKLHAWDFIIFQFEDGKIKGIWEQLDELSLRLQMGGKWAPVAPANQKEAPSPNPAPASPPSH
jgi:predicted ester cyclase